MGTKGKKNADHLEKARRFVFILLLIFLPSQLGLHFWPDWAYVNGVRIDYFSPTLYFTDILVLLLFLLEIYNLKFKILNQFSKTQFLIIFTIGIFTAVNIYFSQLPYLSFYKWLKVGEMAFLAYWVVKNLRHSIKLQHVSVMLLIPICYSAILAVWQFIKQGSVGGLWYWLGERSFTFDTPGIAPGRPYATFPHPNVFLGFLVVAGLVLFKYIPHNYRILAALLLPVAALTFSWANPARGLALRQQLNVIAVQQWLKSPVWGTGLGTSPLYPRNITNYALLHQPIHNIFLLLLAETGLLGLGLFLAVLPLDWLLAPVLFLGLFDHYWLTLQQGQLLFSIIIGWLLSRGKLPLILLPKWRAKRRPPPLG